MIAVISQQNAILVATGCIIPFMSVFGPSAASAATQTEHTLSGAMGVIAT
jgi:hypothetical protein